MKEVRIALLEADVSLSVVRSLIKTVEEKARGQIVTKSVTPGQQVVKIVHDELVQILAGENSTVPGLKVDNPPAAILMVGLQGSGKTTSTAKLAKWLSKKSNKKILMASLDTNRPAAMEQLAILGQQIDVDTLPIIKGQDSIAISKRARQQALLGGYDVFILDNEYTVKTKKENSQSECSKLLCGANYVGCPTGYCKRDDFKNCVPSDIPVEVKEVE